MVKILLFILFVLFNIGFAYIDAKKIKQNKPIYHGVNGLIYLVLLIPVYILTHSWLTVIGLSLIRIPIFNTFLNYFRGKELDYISNTTTSITDQITNFIPRTIGYWNYCLWLFVISLILILI
jgi:drug/metabolite transporter superfamily protein YnfA